ncbi:5-formyltetrahydrofolate cyclo-ligase [Geodermatophilus sabuli]|uniref:5-formyltetrahydrofolate cyclo-ligase n=1 Tax=Geodermatophilus sabuli TaxID=1564158 RepID=A0A7K3W0N3_9ACTN|nr:5-formyltetrahydrofolate cyclo-ligase [Geodermatophilus sabuli]NEK57734.1 5-formyltetrahydrofolate cyclo-ligase [Geodermatophilus sabuli]
MTALAAEKTAVRRSVLARRAARTDAERAAAADAITDALLPELARFGTVAAFCPEPSEPGAGRLPSAYAALDARVLLPVVPSTGREMEWAVRTDRLVAGRYGLLEPIGVRLPPTELGSADAIVLPAVAISRAGVRLGRGGGYYDTSLVHARPDAVLVALAFDDELVDELPAEPHDRLVTAVVTPSGGWQALPASH